MSNPSEETIVPARKCWQVGLRSLFLLVVACAVWLAVLANHRSIETLEKRIAAIRPLARELQIDDPARIAVVTMEPLWYDENRWEIYLPPGSHRLCLATRQIDDAGFAPVVKGAPLGAGRHRLALEQTEVKSGWRVVVTSDGAELLAINEPREWNDSGGATTTGGYSLSTQLPADQPVVLFRRRFSKKVPSGTGFKTTSPKGPTEGVMLWVEPAAGSKAAP